MEFRDPSWHAQDVYDLLEQRYCAYCVMVAPKLKCVPTRHRARSISDFTRRGAWAPHAAGSGCRSGRMSSGI